MEASGSASSVAVSGTRNDGRVAPDTAEAALGLPVTPRGNRCGWGDAQWSWVRRRGLEGLLEGPERGEVRMGTAWWYGGPYGGCIGECVAVRDMLSWRVRGGAEDCVLGSVCWEYRGCAAVAGSSTVGVSRGRLAVLGCPPDPSNNSGGVQVHPLAP